MKQVLGVLSLVLLSGCAPPPREKYVYECSPSLGDVEDCVTAAINWEAKTGVELDLYISDDQCSGFGCIEVHDMDQVEMDDRCLRGHEDVLGCTSYTDRWNVWIVRGMSPDYMLSTYQHELGHALRLNHEPGAILMNSQMQFDPKTNLPVGITPTDVDQYWKVRGVN